MNLFIWLEAMTGSQYSSLIISHETDTNVVHRLKPGETRSCHVILQCQISPECRDEAREMALAQTEVN